MKKSIVILLMLIVALGISAYARTGWVYLNNGNIVKGEVTENETTVFIITEDGTELSYPKLEVNKISYKAPVTPAIGNDPDLKDYSDYTNGFWFSVQAYGGSTLFLSHNGTPLTEIDLAGGYRFNQFLKIGAGFGGRYYFSNSRLRHSDIKWSFPVYLTVRGNFISDTYRTVTPYYSLDLGGSIRDGLMWRPTFGIRIGESRSAFLLGITYTGQDLKYAGSTKDKRKYVSILGLTVGYEF